MAGSIAGAVAGSVASAGASHLMSRAFGGGGGSVGLQPSAFRRSVSGPLGTFNVREGGTMGFFTPSPLRGQLLGEIREQGEFGVSNLDQLLGRVRPGFGELTDARVTAIDRARERTTSDLRGSLGKRRLLGSSFAADSISRAEAEFAEQEQLARAQSFLEELDLTSRLIDQRVNMGSRAAAIELDQANFEAGTLASLMSGTTAAMTSNAQTIAQLAIANAAGAGDFFGQNFNSTFSAIGDAVGAFVQGKIGGGSSAPTGNFTTAGGARRPVFG